MSTTSQSPRSLKSLRRFVTVVACEFRFTQQDLEKLGEETVGLGVDAAWNLLAEKARENGGLVLPLHGSSAHVVFGYPNPDADHAARAVQCARQFIDAAAAAGSEWIPSYGVGIHSADCLILEQGHRSSRSISLSGAAPDCAALLSHVPRNGEILLTESTLKTFASDLPSGIETLQVQFDKEPDLDGLNWEAVVFLGLPEHLRREAVLAGPGVAENPGGAEYFFRYLFSIKILSARATLNILSLLAVEHAPPFLLQAPSARSGDEMTRLGSYTLIKRLGKGGTGQVWLARDFHGNLVALKSLQEAFAGDQRQISRLQREARAMALLPHPNICQVYEVGETDGLHFISMEYISGTTLADLLWSGSGAVASPGTIAGIIQWIQKWQQSHEETETGARPRRLPFPETLRMFCRVCEAVAFAHEHGILHRDLKPGNILLRENGEPVVSDFGLAKMESADTENSLSLHGEILGTLDYMAPEQAHDSKNVDERADIYGLGAILYLLLSGRPHFSPGGDILKDAAQLQTHEPKPLRSLVGNLHPDIALIAEKCLRPHRHDRYQSARMLRDDLERFLLGQPILARPPSPLRLAKEWTSKHKSAVSTVAAACLVLVLFAFYSFAQINRKRIAAEDALATAREAQSHAEESEKRLIAALKNSEQNRLRAESAEFEKQKLSSNLKEERTKVSQIEKAKNLISSEGIAGDDLADPPEPQRRSAPGENGPQYMLRYSLKLTGELAAKLQAVDTILNWDINKNGTPQPGYGVAQLKMLFPEVWRLSAELVDVSNNNPEALVLLAKLATLGIDTGDPRQLLVSALFDQADTAVEAEAQALLCNLKGSGKATIAPEFLRASDSTMSKHIGAIAQTFPNSTSITAVYPPLPGSPLPKANHDNAGIIVVPGANDRLIGLLAEVVRSAGPFPQIDLSYSSATVIPWDLAASCFDFTARKSAATAFSEASPSTKFHLKKLDLANSAFREPGSVPSSLAVESLNINNCPVPDGGFVFGFRELRELYAVGVPFQSLEKIGQFEKLKILRFSPRMVAEQKSIEVLRSMKSLTHIGTDRDKALLPANAFWLLWDADYFKSGDGKAWTGNMPAVGPSHAAPRQDKQTKIPSPVEPPSSLLSQVQTAGLRWWSLASDPAKISAGTNEPAPASMQKTISEQANDLSEPADIIIRMNAIFASTTQSTPTDEFLAKLRPLIGSFGACLNTMNSINSKDPAYVLLCAKYDSLLMDGAKVSDLLQHAGKLAVESNDSSLVEECRVLQETLQQTEHGGALITPFGLRRTGTPDNIRLAALYENIGELNKSYTKSTGQPFPPDLLLRESRPSPR